MAEPMIRILFFGRLREVAGGPSREATGPAAVSELVARLGADDAVLAAALRGRGVRVALNQDMLAAGADPIVQAGDEVAFLPPLSGG